jgi:hypothetical protein
MEALDVERQIALKTILFATDFDVSGNRAQEHNDPNFYRRTLT